MTTMTPSLPAAATDHPALQAASEGPEHTIAREGTRLVMRRAAADTPEFWEAQWRAHPPQRMRGERASLWFRAPMRWLPRDGVVLEAGCGNGNICRTFANEGFRMEGLDFAARVIDANRAADPKGRYTVGDVRALPHANGSLAGYISLGVIEHFDDETRAGILREATRALKRGGIAIITTPAYTPLRRLATLLGAHRAPGAGAPGEPAPLPFYQYFFTPRDLREQVEAAGLRVVARDAYDVYKGLKDTLPGPLGAMVKRWWPHEGPLGRTLKHPWRPLRLLAAHMQLVVARKPW
ncbi:MAG: class I SAM-dependent methyltransferase [Phycisphaerales bacterium]